MNTQAIRLPTTDSLNQGDLIGNSDSQSDSPEETDDSGQTPADLITRVQSTITGMNDMTRMLMWTAIGLPIMLTLFWLLMRGRQSAPEFETSYPVNPNNTNVDTAPHRPSSARRMRMSDNDTAEFAPYNRASRQQEPDSSELALHEDDELNFTAQMDELFGKSLSADAISTKKDTGKVNSGQLDSTSDVVLAAPPAQEVGPTSEPVSYQQAETTADSVLHQEPDTISKPVAGQESQETSEHLSTQDHASHLELNTLTLT